MRLLFICITLLFPTMAVCQVSDTLIARLLQSDSITIEISTAIGQAIEHQTVYLQKQYGNWYKVKYINADDKEVKRIIHKSRIYKFNQKISNASNTITDCNTKTITITYSALTGTFETDLEHCEESRQMEKWLRILKIW